MPLIRELSPHLADMIAAGEVVERPASVVKELLENAIDAGASAVSVELRRGGMSLIRISDNGCGIAPEELKTAFLRHATSKLQTEEDLSCIGTLGFRGEALAAIAAVSRIEILSRRRGAPQGAKLTLEGGVAGEVEACGCPEGTVISVRDLFYNTPARMKFMKKDSAEASAAAAVVQHEALSHERISFKLIRDGAEQLCTPGDGKLLSAIYSALGREFALSLLPVEGRDGTILVEGFISRSLQCRGSRSMQHFYVNGRYVKSALLTAALEEAYRNQMMKGKFPGCVLHLSLPLDAVDVNVHPAKTVVKFLNERAAFDAVHYAAKRALEAGGEGSAEMRASSAAPAAPQRTTPFYQTMTAQEFRARETGAGKPLTSFTQKQPTAYASELPGTAAVADYARPTETPRAAAPVQTPPAAAPVVPTAPSPVPAPKATESPAAQAPASPVEREPIPAAPRQESVPASTSAEAAAPVEMPVSESPAPEMAAEIFDETAQTRLEAEHEAPWRIAGEVLRTYIICEDGEGSVYLIDKHAAHERINFDRMKRSTAPIMGQQLLIPEAVTLAADEYAVLLEHLDTLNHFGFEAEDFGDNTILCRTCPDRIDAAAIAPALEEIAAEILRTGRADPESARDAMLHTMACKAAIKAGMVSDERELRILVDKVQSGEIQFCPHGRPVKVKLSKYELEKMFKRA